MTTNETEFVKAKDLQAGDVLAGGRGTIEKILNDTGLLTIETDVTVFMKDMNSPVERFVIPSHTCEGMVTPE